MAIGKNQITLTFAGDSAQLERSFGRVGIAAQGMGGKVEAASVKGTFHVRQFGAVAAGTYALVGRQALQFGKDSVGAFAEAEEAQTKLGDAFARFPKLADTNINKLGELNTALAQKTKFDDDASAAAEATLAQFKLTGRQIENLIPLVQDYAAKTGKDLPDAATILGRSFLGQTKALKELGINYKSTGNQAKDVANITALLRTQVGGFAETQGKTAAGQAAILSNRFGELKETLGEKLLPVMMKLTAVGTVVVDWIGENTAVVGPLVAVIGAVVVAQWAWNVAMSANPIGLIVIGIAVLVGALVWVATKTRFFQTVWTTSWGAIKGVAVDFWHWMQALPGRFGSLGLSIVKVITWPYRTAFNFIADAWNNTVGQLSWSVPGWVPGVGGKSVSAPRLSHFHRGGVVPGAPGSEMLAVLQAGERVTPAGGGGAATVIEIRSGGSRMDDLLLELLRSAIKDRGGNVQVVLGR